MDHPNEQHQPDTIDAFVRAPVALDERITADGTSPWPVAPDRYRLVVARACPWANRAVIVRRRQAQAVEACASTSSVNSSEGFFQL